MSDGILSRNPQPLRVYFNRHNAAPLVWCVATADWEIAVRQVVFTADVDVQSAYQAKATPDEDDGKPSAWFECIGVVIVRSGIAEITSE